MVEVVYWSAREGRRQGSMPHASRIIVLECTGREEAGQHASCLSHHPSILQEGGGADGDGVPFYLSPLAACSRRCPYSLSRCLVVSHLHQMPPWPPCPRFRRRNAWKPSVSRSRNNAKKPWKKSATSGSKCCAGSRGNGTLPSPNSAATPVRFYVSLSRAAVIWVVARLTLRLSRCDRPLSLLF